MDDIKALVEFTRYLEELIGVLKPKLKSPAYSALWEAAVRELESSKNGQTNGHSEDAEFATPAKEMPDVMTAKQVAGVLKMSPQWGHMHVQKMAREGKINGFKVGDLWRFKREQVEAFMSIKARRR